MKSPSAQGPIHAHTGSKDEAGLGLRLSFSPLTGTFLCWPEIFIPSGFPLTFSPRGNDIATGRIPRGLGAGSEVPSSCRERVIGFGVGQKGSGQQNEGTQKYPRAPGPPPASVMILAGKSMMNYAITSQSLKAFLLLSECIFELTVNMDVCSTHLGIITFYIQL